MKPIHATIAGMIAGSAYFALSERDVPKDSNCSYLAPWTTDLIAWVGGALMMYKGFEHDDNLVSFFGSTVASIHVCQYAAHKVIKNRIR
jgi:hypothetical protein